MYLAILCIIYLYEGYSHIIIVIVLLDVLQDVPMTLALQVIIQLQAIDKLNVTKVTGDVTGDTKRKI